MSTTVRVYTKPDCVQCDWTKRALDQAGINYLTEDLRQPDNLEVVLHMGYKQAPVVVAGEEHWSGFQPERIKELAKRIGGNN